MLAITNLVESGSDNKTNGEYMKCFLFWERILEQTAASRSSYNHGVITKKNRKQWMERQRKYLVPVMRRRMRIFEANEIDDVPPYIMQLFNHFCDRKSSVNLSCIGMEIQFMEQSLREILFKVVEDGEEELDIEALTVILPNLRSLVNGEGAEEILSKK